jgi:hypothetical protein
VKEMNENLQAIMNDTPHSQKINQPNAHTPE